MRAFIPRLSAHYRAHHERNKGLLEGMGLVGIVAFPLLYATRFTGALPQRWDDLPWRAVSVLLCLLMALRPSWPAAARPYFLPYSYMTVFYGLAVYLPLTMLQNRGAASSVVNMVIGVVLIILLTDWRNTLVMLAGGYLLSILVHWIIHPQPQLPVEFVLWWLPLSMVLVAGGTLYKLSDERAERDRRRFYSAIAGSIAHEMRTPLAQVQHALHALGGMFPTRAPTASLMLNARQWADITQAVSLGQHAVTRGLQAITIILQQLSPKALDAGNFTHLSAAQAVERALGEYVYESDAQRAKVSVQVDEDFMFHGDQTAFSLVLFNLIRNALYYEPLHPEITVRVTVGRVPAHHVVVRDTGPGIEPHLLQRLFQDFHTAGKVEGTGLGLAFCKRAVGAFGGDISCRSEPGAFTEFRMTFPPAPAQEHTPARPQQREVPGWSSLSELSGKTVLVVDDHAFHRAHAKARLIALGMHVFEAQHGAQALQLLDGGLRPDAVLMDINMPGLDGVETTRALRARPGAIAHVPVLALTADTTQALADAAFGAGVDGVLAKPVDASELHRSLARALGAAPAAAPVLSPAATAARRQPASQLLNKVRLDDFVRLDMLHELLGDCVGEMRRLVDALEHCAASGDIAGTLRVLHELVGLAGEGGAQALYEAAKRGFERTLEGRSPGGPGWIAEIKALLGATEAALMSEYGFAVDDGSPAAQTSDHS